MIRRVLIPLVLVGLVAAACGESDGAGRPAADETTTTTPAMDSQADVAASTTTTSADEEGQTTGSTETEVSTATTQVSTTTSPTTSTTNDPGRTPATVPDTTIPPVTGEGPADLVDQIIADASGRAGVATGNITVVRSEAVVWNDGSLGCPEPGLAYTQALVEGYWIVVEADGTEYDYRASARGNFKLCEGPPPGGTGTDR
ncbi:MAG: hypothetical protein KJP22_06265 [Acidimicrobiia bacterium]|nr:hypothetical protein [Acidimicrobiia bacterium]MBT8192984.1 hypothetical protein [Acidimicrobiia bacterium]MBT8248064.1 hypothetical protein [Acidimicrobiia bacterium]NNF87965.1 hypothetical protein [Acidimicrobiia bacterium]NNJ46341.1 hypothetical protein [Acidimicrobiia bacterium]